MTEIYKTDEEFWRAMKEYVSSLSHDFIPPKRDPILVGENISQIDRSKRLGASNRYITDPKKQY